MEVEKEATKEEEIEGGDREEDDGFQRRYGISRALVYTIRYKMNKTDPDGYVALKLALEDIGFKGDYI